MAVSSDVKDGGLTAPASLRLFGPAWLLIAVGAAAALFWDGLVSLVGAWSLPEYSHGPIIPLISLFLFLREMREVPPATAAVTDRWPGVFVLALAVAIGVLGSLVRIPDIVTYGFIVWVAGMVLITFGFRRGAMFWPAVLHLIFMLPLPQFVYWQVSIYLQMVSSEIGVALIRLFAIPVYLDGNIIDLGVYKLQVAEACSGLRYLFPMLSFSYVFAVLYQGPKWHKVLLLLAAAPITVAMNSFRIGMIGVLVNSYGIEQAEGFLHTFEGWIIFLACVVILFGMATILQQFTRAPKRLSETLDIEFTGLGDQIRRIGDVLPSRALIVGAMLTLVVAVTWILAPAIKVPEIRRDPLVVFPMYLSGWSGRSQILEPEIDRILGADDYFLATYTHPDEILPVDFFAAYYYRQTEGSGIHSPEVCIPAGGWEVSDWEPTQITLASGETLEVNRAIIQKGVSRQLVYYWFEQRGRRFISDYRVKAYAVLDSLTRGRTDGGIVRLITPLAQREPEAEGDARIQRFMEHSFELLPRYMPE